MLMINGRVYQPPSEKDIVIRASKMGICQRKQNSDLKRYRHLHVHSSIFKNNFYLLLAVLGLCRFIDFSLISTSRDYSLVAVLGLLIPVVSLVAEHKI